MYDYLIVAFVIWISLFIGDSYLEKKLFFSWFSLLISLLWILAVPIFIVSVMVYYAFETIMLIRDMWE